MPDTDLGTGYGFLYQIRTLYGIWYLVRIFVPDVCQILIWVLGTDFRIKFVPDADFGTGYRFLYIIRVYVRYIIVGGHNRAYKSVPVRFRYENPYPVLKSIPDTNRVQDSVPSMKTLT